MTKSRTKHGTSRESSLGESAIEDGIKRISNLASNSQSHHFQTLVLDGKLYLAPLKKENIQVRQPYNSCHHPILNTPG